MRKTLNEVFPDWLTGYGIFGSLQTLNVPWKNDGIASQLDIVFHGEHAGSKPISPLVDRIMTGTSLSATERTLLATAALAMFGTTWGKEYATRSLLYDPIQNYDMVEQMTNDQTVTMYGHTDTRTDNLSHTKTGTETETPNLTDQRTANLTHAKTGTETQTPNTTDTLTLDTTEVLTHDTTEERTDDLTDETTYGKIDTKTPAVTSTSNIYAFNSAAAKAANSVIQSGTDTDTLSGSDTVERDGTVTTTKDGTETTTRDGTETTVKTGTDTMTYNTSEMDTGTDTTVRSGTDTTQYNTTDADTGTSTHAESGSDSQTRNYRLTRSGNIGVTSSQQLIQQERELWLWNFFYDIVFPDLLKILTLSIYE